MASFEPFFLGSVFRITALKARSHSGVLTMRLSSRDILYTAEGGRGGLMGSAMWGYGGRGVGGGVEQFFENKIPKP